MQVNLRISDNRLLIYEAISLSPSECGYISYTNALECGTIYLYFSSI